MPNQVHQARASKPSPHNAHAFEAIVKDRKSVRAFLSDPVPQKLIDHLLALASFAPSNCNTQPWKVEVVSGNTLKRLSTALWEDACDMSTSADIPYLREFYTEDFERRQINHTQIQYDAFGVGREDMSGRMGILKRNMAFFDAPHCLMLLMPKFGNEREAGDLGMFAQTLMLAMTAHGLASVPQTAVGLFAGPIRQILKYDENYKLMFALSFGYENKTRAEARLEQPREPLGNWVRYHQ